jgi:hypothetical protein
MAKENNENSTEAIQGYSKKPVKHSAITKTRFFLMPVASDLLSNFLEIVTALFHDNCDMKLFVSYERRSMLDRFGHEHVSSYEAGISGKLGSGFSSYCALRFCGRVG